MSWWKPSLSPAGLVLHFAHLSTVFSLLLFLYTHILGSLALCLRYESQIFFHNFDTLTYSDFVIQKFSFLCRWIYQDFLSFMASECHGIIRKSFFSPGFFFFFFWCFSRNIILYTWSWYNVINQCDLTKIFLNKCFLLLLLSFSFYTQTFHKSGIYLDVNARDRPVLLLFQFASNGPSSMYRVSPLSLNFHCLLYKYIKSHVIWGLYLVFHFVPLKSVYSHNETTLL